MLSRIHIPHPALSEFVISIMTVDAELPDCISEVATPYPPTPHQSIIFYGNDRISMKKEGAADFELQPTTVVIGPQYTRVNLLVHKRLKAVRVDFYPGGLYRLLGIPMIRLFDGGFNALDILGNEVGSVNEQISNTEDNESRAAVIERFLLEKRFALKDSLPIDQALKLLMRNDGNLKIEKVAALSCLSLRQFERKCMERLGITPKAYARIARFSKAYRLREANPRLTWTAIAHEAGYFDQMHFIKDFKEFAGVTPRIYEEAMSCTPFRMQADLIV